MVQGDLNKLKRHPRRHIALWKAYHDEKMRKYKRESMKRLEWSTNPDEVYRERVFPDAFAALEIRVVPALWKTQVIDAATRTFRVRATGSVVRNPNGHDLTLKSDLDRFFYTAWNNGINEAHRVYIRVEHALVRKAQRSASLNHLRREILSIRKRLIEFRDLIDNSGLAATFREIGRKNAASLVDAIILGITDEVASLDMLDFRKPSSDEAVQNRISEFRKIVAKRHANLGVKVLGLCGARRHVAKEQWAWDRMKKRFFDEDLPHVRKEFVELQSIVDSLKVLQREHGDSKRSS